MKKIRKLPLKKSKDLEGMTKEEKVKQIISRLEKLFPGSKIALNYSSPWELFVAVVLSAQTTDKQVNVVTHDLFAKYKTLEDYVNTPLEEFQNDIKRIGLFRGKGKSIKLTAAISWR
ncbi:MAG: Endonuclease III [Candidatus Levybacteria bacterium GW2011_GWA1_39_32]|nr:MAG: Endonuclease III [Candidatus Levybacteria bacterium GW2011_GWA1_39_32]